MGAATGARNTGGDMTGLATTIAMAVAEHPAKRQDLSYF